MGNDDIFSMVNMRRVAKAVGVGSKGKTADVLKGLIMTAIDDKVNDVKENMADAEQATWYEENKFVIDFFNAVVDESTKDKKKTKSDKPASKRGKAKAGKTKTDKKSESKTSDAKSGKSSGKLSDARKKAQEAKESAAKKKKDAPAKNSRSRNGGAGREKDKYGFAVGTKRSKAIELVATGKYTEREIIDQIDGYGLKKTFAKLAENGFVVINDKDKKLSLKKVA